jgi:hypothetical protein
LSNTTKKILLATGLALSILIAGCSTVKPSGGSYSENKPASDQAKLILYRTGGTLLKIETPIVLLDGKEIGTLPDGGFLEIDTAPGVRAFEIRKYGEKAWRFNPYNFKVSMQGGTTQFIELDITSLSGGWILPLPFVTMTKTESKFELKKRSPSEAAEALAKLQKTLPSDR